MNIKPWKLLSSKIAFDNKWLMVRKDEVELPNGVIMDDYFVYESPNVAMIIPITSDNKLIMVKQYKHAAKKILVEFPAGFIDKESDPFTAAKRELLEETGYETQEWSKVISTFPHPSKVTGITHIYLAENVSKVGSQSLDISEDIEIVEVNISQLEQMIARKDIIASDTLVAALMILPKLKHTSD